MDLSRNTQSYLKKSPIRLLRSSTPKVVSSRSSSSPESTNPASCCWATRLLSSASTWAGLAKLRYLAMYQRVGDLPRSKVCCLKAFPERISTWTILTNKSGLAWSRSWYSAPLSLMVDAGLILKSRFR